MGYESWPAVPVYAESSTNSSFFVEDRQIKEPVAGNHVVFHGPSTHSCSADPSETSLSKSTRKTAKIDQPLNIYLPVVDFPRLSNFKKLAFNF